MKNYADLIDQSFEFPSSEFEVKDKKLYSDFEEELKKQTKHMANINDIIHYAKHIITYNISSIINFILFI